MVTVAQQLLAAVERVGASTVFGLPGVHNLAFWTGDSSSRAPKIMKVRHEQTAVYAADGWARSTGKLGVALVTTGPGAANCAAAFGEAAMARSPVLLVASEVSNRVRAAGLARALHESPDQAAMFRSLAKRTWSPRTPEEATRDVGSAIASALEHPRGPVYLDVPADVLGQQAPSVPTSLPTSEPTDVDETVIRQASLTIERANRVGIWAGGGAVESGGEQAITELAERLHAPLFTTFASRGFGGPTSSVRVALPPHEPAVGDLLAGLDVLVSFGSDFDGMLTKNASLSLPPTIIDVNLLAEERGFGYPTIPIPGDASMVATQLLATVPARSQGPGDELPACIDRAWTELRTDERVDLAVTFVEIVQDIAMDAIVVNDMCIPGYWLGSYFDPADVRRLQYPVGWGTLGYALPAAVGAGAARERKVLAVSGDAGILFGVGELATLSEEQLPVTVLVVDDGGYGMLRFDQLEAGTDPRGMDLRSPDFEQLAGSFGLDSIRINGNSRGEIAGTLASALRTKGPNVVVWETSMFPPRTTSPRWND
jgi:acetolactate synthase I/II/III large subunit